MNRLILIGVLLCAELVLAQQAPKAFDAATILPPAMLNGASYRIARELPVKDHRFQFSIETQYGTFPASGILMLERRLSELRAIDAATNMGQGAVAVNAAWETLRRTPKGAGHLLSDPLGTLSAAPTGFQRMASNVLNPTDRRFGSKTRRQLAVNLGVDPETRNPVLSDLLKQLAARQIVGTTATKFGMSAAVPGLGMLSTMEDFRDQIVAKNAHEILAEIEAELARLGVWKPARDEFVRNPRWTTLEKLSFMKFYRQIANVEHADVMVYLANRDATEADVLRRLAELRLLGQLHRTQPIAILSDGGLPVAVTRDGKIVGVCSVDYLVNTQTVQNAAVAFRKANPNRSLTLLSTGWLSPEAKQALESQQITFQRVTFGDVSVEPASIRQARSQR